MRAVRSVRLVIFVAALAAAMSIGVASASAFSLSSSTATTQAGAPTDMSFTYTATGAQSLSRLDVQLPPGVMHDPSSIPACPVTDFQADRCRTPRAGSTVTRISIGSSEVSVSGDIYPIADPADNSDFPLGIVLRPPFSALGLTGKIYLRDRVSFTNGGGLRHSITGPLSSVSVLGVPLRSRITASRFTFTGHSSRGNQVYNSTSCATTHFRATATFSDGRTEERTSPYSTIGCDKLIFTGGFDVDLDERATQPKSFGAKLGNSARAPAGVTHEYHRSAVHSDLSEIGDWDTEEFLTTPTCSDQEFITNTCPIRSQIGTVSTGIEGFPGTRSGAIYNSYPRGAKPKGRIQLRPGVSVDFTLDFVTDASGRSSLHIDDLPQLPVTDFKIEISAAGPKLRLKPAGCSNREIRTVNFGHNGGQTNTTAKYPPLPCPPGVSFADAGDADADGDGLADKSLKPENFHVWYSVSDGGNGIDPESARCELESPDPASAVRGKVKIVRDTGNGYVGCEVTESAGDVTVVFSIASIDGHVTVLKSSYNVDSEAPVVESVAPEPIESSSTQVVLPFTFTDDRIDHPQSEYEIECVIEDSDGNRHTTTPGHKYIDKTLRTGGGECMWDTGRKGRFSGAVTLQDNSGHVTVLKRTIIVDPDGPTITLTDWRDQDDDGDGLPTEAIRLSSFDVPFSLADDSGVDPASVSCKLINPVAMDKGLRVADLDGDGAPDVCNVTDAPGGPVTVEISAADWRGHVTVLKLAYTIDTEAPAIETSAPDKVVYDLSTFDYEFEFTDDTAKHPQSKFKAGAEIEIKTGVVSSSAKIVTDRDTGRSKGFARFENIPDGVHELTLTVEDSTGHVTVLKHSITVDTEPPVITLTDPRDQDSDGDGLADDELRPETFDIPLTVADASGKKGDKITCNVTFTNPVGKCVPVDLDGDGFDDVVRVSDAPGGPLSVEISAFDWRGHVTVLKLGYTVDADPPAVETTAPDKVVYDLPRVDFDFEVTDDTMTHPQSEYGAECRIRSPKLEGGKEGLARVIVDRDTGRSKGFCTIDEVPDGEYEFTLRVRDKVGHVTLIKRTFQVDAQGPVITLVNPEGTDSDGDGVFDETRYVRTFDRAIVVTDHSDLDLQSVKCTVRGWDPTTKQQISAVDLDGDGLADVCRITDAPDGLHMIEISAADVHGHVTVLKLAVTVEANPPVVTITSPAEGATIPYNGTLTVGFDVVSETAVTATCRVDTIVIAMACSSGQTFTVTGMGAGAHVLSVTVEDEHGLTTTASRSFSVASAPPPGDVCIAIYPPPEGCPGYIPPGSTICVTVPYPICYPAGSPPGGTITLP